MQPGQHPIGAHAVDPTPQADGPLEALVTPAGQVLLDLAATLDESIAAREADPDLAGVAWFPPEEVFDALRAGDYTAGELNVFLQAYLPYCQPRENGGSLANPAVLLNDIPTERLREAYMAAPESGPAADAARNMIGVLCTSGRHGLNAVDVLMRVYDLEDPLLLMEQPSLRQDSNIALLVDQPGFPDDVKNMWVRQIRGQENDPRFDTQVRDWARRYLSTLAELPGETIDELLFASYGRTFNYKTGRINLTAITDLVVNTAQRVQELGANSAERIEAVRLLRQRAGIISLDQYLPGQLERMVRFLRGDQELIKHLQNGDVTVVFRDANGDYNGATQDDLRYHEKPSGRTLFFEVHQPSDFRLFMSVLHNRKVKPSTVVVAAHGTPGAVWFGDGEGMFPVTNDAGLIAESRGVSIDDAVMLTELFAQCTQDSKGEEDDPEEAKGRRRLLFHVCQAAAATGNEAAARGMSVAEDVLKKIALTNLDVYAGKEIIVLWPTPDGKGVYMLAVPPDNLDGPRTPTTIVRLRLNEQHQTERQELASLQLWR